MESSSKNLKLTDQLYEYFINYFKKTNQLPSYNEWTNKILTIKTKGNENYCPPINIDELMAKIDNINIKLNNLNSKNKNSKNNETVIFNIRHSADSSPRKQRECTTKISYFCIK